MTEFRIGQRLIGPDQPIYFIAEAGSNHNRDLGMAKQLIDIAAEAGADAVKFQTFRADSLYPRSAGMTDYLKTPRKIYDIIRDLEMPLEWIAELARYAGERKIDFLSTPFDEAAVHALAPYVAAFKIASYEMTHYGLVQLCARLGKPVMISTGAATFAEVSELVEAVRAVSDVPLALLQCTARYPAPLESLNLRAMRLMGEKFGVPVGLSDHSREPLPGPMAAAALGASIIEKHFTISNTLPGPDHVYALEPKELKEVIQKIREVERSLGSGAKEPHAVEEELRHFARRSVFATRPIGAGEALGTKNAAVLRCGKLVAGVHPRDYIRLLGRVAKQAIAADTAICESELEPLRLGDEVVGLRPLALEDSEKVVRWRNLPEVAGQFFSARPPTLEEHVRWFQGLQLRSDRLEFIIEWRGQAIGTIGLSDIDLGRKSAQYGIVIGEAEARGKAVALAASRHLLEYAFGVLGLDEVTLLMFADNQPARRLYDKLGFKEVTPAPPARLKDGRLRELTQMCLKAGSHL